MYLRSVGKVSCCPKLYACRGCVLAEGLSLDRRTSTSEKKLVKYCSELLRHPVLGTKNQALMSQNTKQVPQKMSSFVHPRADQISESPEGIHVASYCNASQENSDPPKNPGPDLDMVASQLTEDLGNIFMQRQNWALYHKEMVFKDNISGLKVVGLEKYKLCVSMLVMLAHLRLLYVRMSLLSLSKEEEEGVITVRWSIVGLGIMRMLCRYFPDRLWEKGNMERLAPVYMDGFSTFYVNSNSKIYQHTVDRVREDKDKDKVGRKSVIQKLGELRPWNAV